MASYWQPKQKQYRHFDGLGEVSRLASLAMDPKAVTSHPFYPLISYQKRWLKYTKAGAVSDVKDRTIRYASRKDAAVFSYYRSILAQKYEEVLAAEGLSESILAYRRVRKAGGAGKSNIEFALDAFQFVRTQSACSYLALDVSGFFDNLDHFKIKRDWEQLLGVKNLPDDHYHVFKHLTKYGEVTLDQIYRALGIKGDVVLRDGSTRIGFLKRFDEIEAQICRPEDFRDKIAKAGLISTYKDRGSPTFGVPQGVPLSDLLANLYLLDFDRSARSLVKAHNGFYARYSDDIIVIIPKDELICFKLYEELERLLRAQAPRLTFKRAKTEVGLFFNWKSSTRHVSVIGKRGGMRYLGFRFDGTKVFIRDQTLSNLWRSTSRFAKAAAIGAAKRYMGKPVAHVRGNINEGRLLEKTGRVEDFMSKAGEYRRWTFWTYATRAHNVFLPFGSGINSQLKRHRTKTLAMLDRYVIQAVAMVSDPKWQNRRKAK